MYLAKEFFQKLMRMRFQLLVLPLILCMMPMALSGNTTLSLDKSGFAVFSDMPVDSVGYSDLQMREEMDFILYLVGRGDLDEGLFLLEGLRPAGEKWRDSLNYLTGWVLYRQKNLDASAGFLLSVSCESPVYHKSHFFGAYNLAHTGDHAGAGAVLSSMSLERGKMLAAMKRLQLGGLALLARDFDGYSVQARHFSGQYHVMAAEERRMEQHHAGLRDAPGKSPWIGGLLSAAVPGLGRVYAGKSAEGIVGFLYVAALGLTSYDIYRGTGARNPLFILSASVTGVFYVGNILGSATAVRRTNKEFNHEMDQRILFDMHIPLRNAFN